MTTADEKRHAHSRAGHEASHLPGTDADEWLSERKKGTEATVLGGEEGEIYIHLSKGNQSARQVRDGAWADIPVDEALKIARERCGT